VKYNEIQVNYLQDFVASTQSNSFKDRRIGAYFIGLTVPGQLGCTNNKKKNFETALD
jgi:hypothetical protein